jgi:uncharacterized membrane protein
MTGDAQRRIELYLGKLRRNLRKLPEQDVRDIVEELRSHILDKAAANGGMTPASVDSTLDALGTPEDLASSYVTDNVLAGVEGSRSPFGILKSLSRWASLSLAGFFVLLGCVLGYSLGAVFFLCAVLKPFHSQTAGVWLIPSGAGGVDTSIRLGFGSAPPNGHEVLGWWIVPAGLLVGGGLVLLSTRAALWCAGKYRKSRVLPGV